LEDGSTLENTQRGIEAGVITHYPLQDQELLIRHAHKVAEDMPTGGAQARLPRKGKV
jgi:hypothetical protein